MSLVRGYRHRPQEPPVCIGGDGSADIRRSELRVETIADEALRREQL